MKRVIINADDFGYCDCINSGILEAVKNGVVSSTSVMVYGKAVDGVEKLKEIEHISTGLHFHLDSSNLDPEEEFNKQINLFMELLSKRPDHIDIHKPRSINLEIIIPILQKYSAEYKTPVRELGHAKSIKQFFGIDVTGKDKTSSARVSVASLLNILDHLEDGDSEIMTHAGHSNEELRSLSSYSDMREIELQTLTDPGINDHIAKSRNLQLISWNEVVI